MIAEGLQLGFLTLIVAAIPATCGHDIEVPESKLNGDGFWPAGASEVSLVPIHAARIFTPGAAMSGCMHAETKLKLLIYPYWRHS